MFPKKQISLRVLYPRAPCLRKALLAKGLHAEDNSRDRRRFMTTVFDFQLAKTLQHNLDCEESASSDRCPLTACLAIDGCHLPPQVHMVAFERSGDAGETGCFLPSITKAASRAPIECCASKDSNTLGICRLSTAPKILERSRQRRKALESPPHMLGTKECWS